VEAQSFVAPKKEQYSSTNEVIVFTPFRRTFTILGARIMRAQFRTID
jgi:hypothetical protein